MSQERQHIFLTGYHYLHNYTFSLSGKKDDRSRSTQSIAFMSNAERNWYFCFFIAYREPGSFCREKRGKNRRAKRVEGGLALAVFPYGEDCDSPE